MQLAGCNNYFFISQRRGLPGRKKQLIFSGRGVCTLSGEARILKRGEETALYAELDGIPTAEALCTLPQSGKFRLRLAGFDGAVPGELIFSGLMDANCPADVVLDCTYLADRPALGISVCNEALDEQALVDLARNAVTERGEALRVDFAS